MANVFFRRKDIFEYFKKRRRECIKVYRKSLKRLQRKVYYNCSPLYEAYRYLIYARENKCMEGCFLRRYPSKKINGKWEKNIIDSKAIISSVSSRLNFIEDFFINKKNAREDDVPEYLLHAEEIKRFILIVKEYPFEIGGMTASTSQRI